TSANDRFSKPDRYHAIPPPITGNFLTPRVDISFAGSDEFAIRKKIIESKTTKLKSDTSKSKTSETVGKTNDANTEKPKSVSESVVSNPKINKDSVIIEDWNSDGEEKEYEIQTVRPETQTVKTRDDKSGQTSQKQGIGLKKVKACFVCKSTNYLIKDCNFHDKKSQEPKLKNVVNTGQREGKPVRDNTKRVNHQNFLKYPHLSKTFVPSGVQTRTGLHRPSVSTASPSISTARHVSATRPSINTARPVCTARPSINTTRPSINTARPIYASRLIYPRMDNVRPRGSCSPIKRAVVNTGKGKMDTDLKKSRWVWRPKGNYLDHVSKDSGSFMLKKGNPEILLQDHAVVDSGCSSHMTGNKAYLSDYEDFNGGFVAFGSDPKGGEIPGTRFEEKIQKVSLVRESMKEKSTDFVTPTKAPGEAQEEEISLSFRGGSRKGINIAKTAQDEFNNEREAFMKDKVKDASLESEIGVDAIPAATKPPTIKYRANRPEEMYDRVLWGDLKTMFDPPLSDDAIWNRKYPLSKDACQVMLKMKLLDGTMDEVCYQLLKIIEKQVGIRKHQELASPRQTALLATPEQTATGKEISNLLIADSLLKTIRHKARQQDKVYEEREESCWVLHLRTGIFYPKGHEGVMNEVLDGAAIFASSYWLRNNDMHRV
ncbi:hypothetical protein Tco_0901966, partial [Tanacetum coccineum]